MKKYKIRIDRTEFGNSVAFIVVALPDGIDPKELAGTEWGDIVNELDYEEIRWDAEHEISAELTDENIEDSFSYINGEFVEDDMRDLILQGDPPWRNVKIG